jgi:hypothetical protein
VVQQFPKALYDKGPLKASQTFFQAINLLLLCPAFPKLDVATHHRLESFEKFETFAEKSKIGFISPSNPAISVRAAYPLYFPISVANADGLLTAPPDGRLCSDAAFRSLTTTIDFSSRRCSKSWASLLFAAICYGIDNVSIHLSFHERC